MTERAHAVDPVTKVSSAIRDLPAMPERVRFGWSFAPTPHRKEIGKKMSKSVDKMAGVWYYT